LEFELTRDYKHLIVYAKNNGKVYAKYINVYLRIWERFLEGTPENFGTDKQREIYADNTIRDFIGIKGSPPNHIDAFGPSRYEPILPQLRFKIQTINLGQYALDDENIIEYDVYCDNAPVIKNEIMVKSIIKTSTR